MVKTFSSCPLLEPEPQVAAPPVAHFLRRRRINPASFAARARRVRASSVRWSSSEITDANTNRGMDLTFGLERFGAATAASR